MAVDLDEAIRRAVKSFYEKGNFEEYEKTSGKKSKYSGEMFDAFEKKLRKKSKNLSNAQEEIDSEEDE